MYGSPATPFVAEFIGTMNRLVSRTAGDGLVEYAGRKLPVDAAEGLPANERVLLLVRPETVDVEPATGATNRTARSIGEVASHTFLGAVTRVRIDDGDGGRGITADVSTAKAAQMAVGTRVVARFPAAGARLLSLHDEELPVVDPDDQ